MLIDSHGRPIQHFYGSSERQTLHCTAAACYAVRVVRPPVDRGCVLNSDSFSSPKSVVRARNAREVARIASGNCATFSESKPALRAKLCPNQYKRGLNQIYGNLSTLFEKIEKGPFAPKGYLKWIHQLMTRSQPLFVLRTQTTPAAAGEWASAVRTLRTHNPLIARACAPVISLRRRRWQSWSSL